MCHCCCCARDSTILACNKTRQTMIFGSFASTLIRAHFLWRTQSRTQYTTKHGLSTNKLSLPIILNIIGSDNLFESSIFTIFQFIPIVYKFNVHSNINTVLVR